MNVLHDCVRWHLTVVAGTNIEALHFVLLCDHSFNAQVERNMEVKVAGKLHVSVSGWYNGGCFTAYVFPQLDKLFLSRLTAPR